MKREIMNMNKLFLQNPMVAAAIVAMWSMNGACLGFAQESAPRAFQSPAEASQTLFQAVQRNDGESVEKYQEMHRLGRDTDGSESLYIGAENWPFPIPLVEKNGAWQFDSVAGLKEVLFRRIGENELTAIETCHALVAAERQFRASPKTASLADSPLASLLSASASESSSAEPVLIQGYYFRILENRRTEGKTADGFGFVAYPAEYRSSGVMTFIVMQNDVVKEKDLGTNTSAAASALAGPPKELDWVPSDEK